MPRETHTSHGPTIDHANMTEKYPPIIDIDALDLDDRIHNINAPFDKEKNNAQGIDDT
jgi:hypothetical protein